MDLLDVSIRTEYNQESDTWHLQASNPYLKGSLELTYKAVLTLNKEIFKIIQGIQPDLEALIKIVLDYHQGRKGQYYFDFLKKGSGIITEELLDESKKPELTITMAWEHFIELISGEKDAQTMFMTGNLKMAGNLAKALKLQNVVSSTITGLKAKL